MKAKLKSVPDSLLKGLQKSDQQAIKEAVGTIVDVIEVKNGEAEVEFVDKHRDTHTIWVAENHIEEAGETIDE